MLPQLPALLCTPCCSEPQHGAAGEGPFLLGTPPAPYVPQGGTFPSELQHQPGNAVPSSLPAPGRCSALPGARGVTVPQVYLASI